jgi:hypothetical protein
VSIVNVNGTEMYVTSLSNLSSNVVTIPLSSLIESLELVQLEDHADAFFKPWFTTVTEKYIGIRQQGSRPYLLFERSGKFLGNAGSVGQGPGEYSITPYDDVIDDKNGLIYLAPFIGSNILVYSASGAFLREIAAPQRLNKSKIFLSDNILTILHMSFGEDSPMGYQIANPAGTFTQSETAELMPPNPETVTQLQISGQILSGLATPAHFVVQSFDGEIFNTRNVEGVFDFTQTGIDTLFHFDMKNSRILPVFTMVSSTEGVWKNYFQVNKTLIMTGVNEFDPESGHFVNRGIVATDLKNMTSSYVNVVNDFFGNLPVIPSIVTFRNGYFVYNVQPEELMDEIENRLTESSVTENDRQKLRELLSKLKKDANNVMFIGKLKNEIEKPLW